MCLTGDEIHTQRATHVAYERRADVIKPNLATYAAAKEQAPDRALEIDPMEYGKGHEVCDNGLYQLVSEGVNQYTYLCLVLTLTLAEPQLSTLLAADRNFYFGCPVSDVSKSCLLIHLQWQINQYL